MLTKNFLIPAFLVLLVCGCVPDESARRDTATTRSGASSSSPTALAPTPRGQTLPTWTATSPPPQATPTTVPVSALSPAFLGDVLFGDSTPGCQLPCWQGLRMGVSGSRDIQRVFDTALGFGGEVDFFSGDPPISHPNSVNLPDTYTTGYEWVEDGSFLAILVVTDDKGDHLQGIQLQTVSGVYPPYSPRQMIQRLGNPDYAATSIELSPGDDVGVNLVVAYKEGLAFSYGAFYPGSEIQRSDGVTYCLDRIPLSARYFIVDPFSDFSTQSATPLHREWIFDLIERKSMRPVEEALGLSCDELGRIALSDSPCLTIAKP